MTREVLAQNFPRLWWPFFRDVVEFIRNELAFFRDVVEFFRNELAFFRDRLASFRDELDCPEYSRFTRKIAFQKSEAI